MGGDHVGGGPAAVEQRAGAPRELDARRPAPVVEREAHERAAERVERAPVAAVVLAQCAQALSSMIAVGLRSST